MKEIRKTRKPVESKKGEKEEQNDNC